MVSGTITKEVVQNVGNNVFLAKEEIDKYNCCKEKTLLGTYEDFSPCLNCSQSSKCDLTQARKAILLSAGWLDHS